MKYKYRLKFFETIEHEIEFETDEQLDKDGDLVVNPINPELTDDEPWFHALDAANPNWLQDSAFNIEERELRGDVELVASPITCKLCHKPILAAEAHAHQGQYVGTCCWDERLRASE